MGQEGAVGRASAQQLASSAGESAPGECEANVKLLDAAAKGDLEEASKLIREEAADAAWQEEEGGLSPLMVAARAGHLEVVNLLLENGAPWNAVDRRGRCAGDHALEALRGEAEKEKELHTIAEEGAEGGEGLKDGGAAVERDGVIVTEAARAAKKEKCEKGKSETEKKQGGGMGRGEEESSETKKARTDQSVEEGGKGVVGVASMGGSVSHSTDGSVGPSVGARLQAVVDRVLDAGIQSELILGAALRHATKERVEADQEASNAEYLKSRVEFGEGRIVDGEKGAVMMQWEKALMEAHAQAVCQQRGHILNVGFGMGLVDSAISSRNVASHTIIEAHPDVLQRMEATGWSPSEKPGLTVVAGRWQDVLASLKSYDGIFFDTYGEHYEDLREFHSHLPALLKPDGVYSFFNGMCADSPFFHMVYCQIVALELAHMGITTDFVELPVAQCLAPEVWEGVRRKYWQLDTYYLPVCYWAEDSTEDQGPET